MHKHDHGCGPRERSARFIFGGREFGRGFGMNFGPRGFHFDFGDGPGEGGERGGGGRGPRGRRRMFGSGELGSCF